MPGCEAEHLACLADIGEGIADVTRPFGDVLQVGQTLLRFASRKQGAAALQMEGRPA